MKHSLVQETMCPMMMTALHHLYKIEENHFKGPQQHSLADTSNLQLGHPNNVWFQKISLPTPRRVIGNSKGEGITKAKIFKGECEPKSSGISRGGVGGVWIFSVKA